MGGSVGKAVDKITKETSGGLKKATGGAVDLGSTDVQSQAETFADESGLQGATDKLVATADTDDYASFRLEDTGDLTISTTVEGTRSVSDIYIKPSVHTDMTIEHMLFYQ